MIRIVLPRLLRVASFRFAAFYVAVFTGSALVLGIAVFFEARSALQQQMTERIETEAAFLVHRIRRMVRHRPARYRFPACPHAGRPNQVTDSEH